MDLLQSLSTKIKKFWQSTPAYKYEKQMQERYSATPEGKQLIEDIKGLSIIKTIKKYFKK